MPSILTTIGMSPTALFVSVCLVCLVGSLLIALIANLPVAIGPAVAILAYFTTVVVQSNDFTWQQGILAVFIAALGLVMVTAFHLQKKIVTALPNQFFSAVCAGLGLFLMLIALNNAHILSMNHRIFKWHWQPWTGLSFIFLLSFVITITLDRLKIMGSFLLAIVISTLVAWAFGFIHYHGLLSMPPSLSANLLKPDWSFVNHLAIWHAAICLLLITLFDNTGTLVGLTQTMHHMTTDQARKAVSKGVIANAIASFFASLLSSPCTSTYLESASGIRAGGKTGLTSSVTATCFLLLLFFSPLVATVPSEATSAILLYIGFLMFSQIQRLRFNEPAVAWGSLCTAVMIPITFSVAEGLGAGLMLYSVMSTFTSNTRKQFNKKTIGLTVFLIVFMVFFHFI
jgi:AGZA family xanthine/uracil permease-like MFS transporter